MTNLNPEAACVMRDATGREPPVLTAVHWHGRLDGPLLSATLRQTYRNATAEPVEAIYTFPLAPGAVLLGMAAQFGEHRLEGEVLPRRQAEATYEEALAQGDAPLLLEQAGNGLFTANLGNLKPGEAVTVELRIGEWVAFDQGRLRVVVPTTIAPRYGNPMQGVAQLHQVPQSSLTVGYGFEARLEVLGTLARGRLECPTHAASTSATDAGLRLELSPGATLDRDLVILLTPAEPLPALLATARDPASDDAPQVALAAFVLPDRPARDAIALQMLVDCSGSMGGIGIESARRALNGVLAQLGPRDRAGLTRFGSHTERAVPVGACDAGHIARLYSAVEATDATLGGTEMQQALRAVCADARGRGDVLLITDGEIWAADAMAAEARSAGQRVFAIGVGSAPAAGVLRQLAEATGGAAEFATPGESLEQAVVRMLRRIRQRAWVGPRVDWGTTPRWQWAPPIESFGGDTLLVAAGFGEGEAPAAAVRLLGGGDEEGARKVTVIATTSARLPVAGDDLARMAAARRLAGLNATDAAALALAHRLVGPHTHCVLVHRRAAGEQVEGEARLHAVPQMLAAGWGGTGMVRPQAAALSLSMDMSRHCAFEDPCIISPRAPRPMIVVNWPPAWRLDLLHLAQQIADAMDFGMSTTDLPWIEPGTLQPNGPAAFAEAQALGIEPGVFWLLLVAWAAGRPGDDGDPALAARLARHAAARPNEERQRAAALFERHLGGIAASPAPVTPGDPTGRLARLGRALLGRG